VPRNLRSTAAAEAEVAACPVWWEMRGLPFSLVASKGLAAGPAPQPGLARTCCAAPNDIAADGMSAEAAELTAGVLRVGRGGDLRRPLGVHKGGVLLGAIALADGGDGAPVGVQVLLAVGGDGGVPRCGIQLGKEQRSVGGGGVVGQQALRNLVPCARGA
jgi:hypothetical protein